MVVGVAQPKSDETIAAARLRQQTVDALRPPPLETLVAPELLEARQQVGLQRRHRRVVDQTLDDDEALLA